MSFATDGYEICRGLIAPSRIEAIRSKMLAIMAPHCRCGTDGPDALDRCFLDIAAQGQTLKSNVYKLFGRLADLPLLLGADGVRDKVEALGFSSYTIQAYSIFCLEAGNTKHMFLPHQDLRDRTSLKSLIVWVPLCAGDGVGGLALYPGTHRKGPLRHGLSARGQLMLDANTYAGAERVELTAYEIGDCAVIDPYLIHESIGNTGKGVRWTAIVKIDDASAPTHARNGIHPFEIDDYIDTRTNEERLRDTQDAAGVPAG